MVKFWILQFLTIFVRTVETSSRILAAGSFKNPWRSWIGFLTVLIRILKDPWQSWEGSVKIFKDLQRSFKMLTRIFKDPWKILMRIFKDPWTSCQETWRSLRIFKDPCWASLLRSSLRSLRRSLKILEDPVRFLTRG